MQQSSSSQALSIGTEYEQKYPETRQMKSFDGEGFSCLYDRNAACLAEGERSVINFHYKSLLKMTSQSVNIINTYEE
jgi:hypothetical protein